MRSPFLPKSFVLTFYSGYSPLFRRYVMAELKTCVVPFLRQPSPLHKPDRSALPVEAGAMIAARPLPSAIERRALEFGFLSRIQQRRSSRQHNEQEIRGLTLTAYALMTNY